MKRSTSSIPAATRRRLILGGTAAALGAGLGVVRAADTLPSRPIRWIVPYAAGGPSDVFTRPIAAVVSEILRQPVIVENLGGSGGNIGCARIARAAADGYTIGLISTGTHTINPHIYPKLSFDPLSDFTPLTLACRYANQLIVNSQSGIRTVSDLVARAKVQTVSYGSAGIGASNHLSGEILSRVAGVPLVHVPFRGNGLALAALMAGDITFMFDMPTNSQPAVTAGRVRQLAVTTAKRWSFLPTIPTMAEAGFGGFNEVGADLWFAVAAPPRLPEDIRSRLYAALTEALRSPRVSKTANEQQFEIWTSTPEDLVREIHTGLDRWGRIARTAGVKA
ncbi:MAG: Bug family tripartite tricarboxylate transporter substrate binding protein [Pseudomonadales bacterium]